MAGPCNYSSEGVYQKQDVPAGARKVGRSVNRDLGVARSCATCVAWRGEPAAQLQRLRLSESDDAYEGCRRAEDTVTTKGSPQIGGTLWTKLELEHYSLGKEKTTVEGVVS